MRTVTEKQLREAVTASGFAAWLLMTEGSCGNRGNASGCPLARYLQDRFDAIAFVSAGELGCVVNPREVLGLRGTSITSITPPEWARHFILSIDAGGNSGEPIELDEALTALAMAVARAERAS